MERLNKYLASCGICSRREADKLILQGRVTVNGSVADTGMQVDESMRVCVNGKPVHGKNEKVVLAYYKPIGVTCTEKDRFADKKITDVVKFPVRVTYAGRLDKDSEGLLLLTNDGDLIDSMMRGSNHHEKEYIVKVHKEITDEFIAQMSQGVFLEELKIQTRPCKVEQIGKFTFRIILTQGVNRQIRRMAETLNFKVTAIKRIRVVNIKLEKLQVGQYRQILGEELAELYRLCGSKTQRTKERN